MLYERLVKTMMKGMEVEGQVVAGATSNGEVIKFEDVVLREAKPSLLVMSLL